MITKLGFKIRTLMDGNLLCDIDNIIIFIFKIRPLMDGNFTAVFI